MRRHCSAQVPLTEGVSLEELTGDGGAERGEEERGGASGTSLNVSTENPAGFLFLFFFILLSPAPRSTPATRSSLNPPDRASTLSGTHLVSPQETGGGWSWVGHGGE